MKFLLMFLLIFFIGCEIPQEQVVERVETNSCIGRKLQGEHELRKFQPVTTTYKKTNASFFLIAGGMNSEEGDKRIVTFSWLGNDSIYNISSIPLEKVRVRIKEDISTPYVKFYWGAANYDCNDVAKWMDHVGYMVIYCKSSDWTLDLQLNEI